LAQDQIFRLQLSSRLEERGEDVKKQLEQIHHQAASLPRLFFASIPNRIFVAPGKVQRGGREYELKPFIAIQRVQLPPGKGEPASRKRALGRVKCFMPSALVPIRLFIGGNLTSLNPLNGSLGFWN
jgi:hypothetical protein